VLPQTTFFVARLPVPIVRPSRSDSTAVEGDHVVHERQVRRRAATVAPDDDPVEAGADDRVLGDDDVIARG
jgi:hypothetical protein